MDSGVQRAGQLHKRGDL